MFSSASGAAIRQVSSVTASVLGLFFLGVVGVPGFRQVDGLLQRPLFVPIVSR
jgi:hypothetical protein